MKKKMIVTILLVLLALPQATKASLDLFDSFKQPTKKTRTYGVTNKSSLFESIRRLK